MKKGKWILMLVAFFLAEAFAFKLGPLLLGLIEPYHYGIDNNAVIDNSYEGWHTVQPWADEPATVKMPILWTLRNQGTYTELFNENGVLIGFLGKDSDGKRQPLAERYFDSKIVNQTYTAFEMNKHPETYAFATYCHAVLENGEAREYISLWLKLNPDGEMWGMYLFEQEGGLPSSEAEAIALSLSDTTASLGNTVWSRGRPCGPQPQIV